MSDAQLKQMMYDIELNMISSLSFHIQQLFMLMLYDLDYSYTEMEIFEREKTTKYILCEISCTIHTNIMMKLCCKF